MSIDLSGARLEPGSVKAPNYPGRYRPSVTLQWGFVTRKMILSGPAVSARGDARAWASGYLRNPENRAHVLAKFAERIDA
jgi:hypothetical protein